MPTFLSDPSLVLYALLAVAFIIAIAVWYRRRDRKSLLAVGITGLLLGGLFLIDRTFESPREQAVRRVETLAAAATSLNPALFVEQLSATFRANGGDREKVRNAGFWGLIRQYQARVVVWGFSKAEFQEFGENEIEIAFYVKGEAAGVGAPLIKFARARFVRDPDGQFRANGIKFFAVESGQEETIPGFP